MSVSRRQFLASTAWSAFAGTASASRSLPQAEVAGTANAFTDWAWVQRQFDLTPEYLHLSQFFLVSHPRPVREAIDRLRRAIDANPFLTVEQGAFDPGARNLASRAKRAAADYIGSRPEDIALVDSTTQGLALVYHGLSLKPGDEILTTTHDHFVHHESIRLAAQKAGATWRRVPLYAGAEEVTVHQITRSLRQAIAPQTRAVGLTWVHSGTGVKLPIRELAAVVSEANRQRAENDRILLVVDGVHGFGNQDESPIAMGCDFFVAGTHKWIFAPRGTGIVWARAETWTRIRPTIPTLYGFAAFEAWMENKDPGPTQADFVSPGGFKAFEYQWAMPEAFAFHQGIGRKRIAERTTALSTQCKEGLAQMSHVKLHTPRAPELSAGMNCFEVAGMAAATAVQKLLERKVIASTSPYKISYVRLAPSLVNDEHQVDQALSSVHALS
jgi:isopenicillin-N epimerase